MIRKHASLLIAMLLVASVATACIVRTRPAGQTAQPVYVEKHKDHHDNGKHKGDDHDHDHDNGHGHGH